MKRLTWLLLAVFCVTLAQVRPMDIAKAKTCERCQNGACGMPCCPAPAPASATNDLAPTAETATVPARGPEASRIAGKAFDASFFSAAATSRPFDAAPAATPARVPLFKAHCSFLI